MQSALICESHITIGELGKRRQLASVDKVRTHREVGADEAGLVEKGHVAEPGEHDAVRYVLVRVRSSQVVRQPAAEAVAHVEDLSVVGRDARKGGVAELLRQLPQRRYLQPGLYISDRLIRRRGGPANA